MSKVLLAVGKIGPAFASAEVKNGRVGNSAVVNLSEVYPMSDDVYRDATIEHNFNLVLHAALHTSEPCDNRCTWSTI